MGLELPSRRQMRDFLIFMSIGAIGGVLALLLGLPLPFMMGGLAASICVVLFAESKGHHLSFPKLPRMICIGIIGVMIGGTFSPDVVQVIPSLGFSLFGITLFVLIAHAMSYAICRHAGGYDPVTAFYASMPGGLIEAVSLGEKAGGNIPVLTLQHFMRVMTVVVFLPFFFYLTSGEIVGSAAGQTFATDRPHLIDIELILVLTVLGLLLGKFLRLPAAHLLGPMILSAGLHGADIISLSSPTWLLFFAQLVVGAGLGAQFSGSDKSLLKRAIGINFLMVACMLSLSAVFAFGLSEITRLDFEALFLSFAPGGVTESGLIALSLSISPVIVASHHVYRIFLAVLIAAISTRFFKPAKSNGIAQP